jgi:hypothetical protein
MKSRLTIVANQRKYITYIHLMLDAIRVKFSREPGGDTFTMDVDTEKFRPEMFLSSVLTKEHMDPKRVFSFKYSN